MIEVFQLESAVCCNLNCKFCYRHTNLEEIENTFISVDETRNLFNRNTLCQNISIVNKGEFFVHADWKNIFSYVAEEVSESEFCEAIILITNTTLMTEEKTDYIFETLEKFNFNLRISFSVNAFNPETFLKITGKNLLEKINQNINYFYNKLSKSSACDRVWTNIQFLVTEDNFCEALDFIQYWKTFLDKQNLDYDICEDNFNSKKKHIITLKRMYAGVKGGGECFEKAASEAEIKFNFKRGSQIEYGNDYFRKKACMFVFKHPVISENKKTICCRDVFFEHSYPVKGDFSEQFELYTRTSHILGRFENLSLCLKCTEYVEVDFDTIKEFSDKTALYNLIDIYNKRKKHGIPFNFYKIDFEKKDSQFIKEFLKNNEFTCFKTSTLIKNDIIPVNLEKDFCAYWTSILKVKNGRMYAGCHKIDIEIDDFNSYKENLKNDNFKEIPVECIICSVKKSVNSIQDRFRTFGKNSFHSFIENYHEKNKNIQTLLALLKNQKFKELNHALFKLNNFYFYLKIIEAALEKYIDCDDFFEIIQNCQDYFVVSEYAFLCDEKFEQVINKLLEFNPLIVEKRLLSKLVEYVSYQKIPDCMNIIAQSSDWTFKNFEFFTKDELEDISEKILVMLKKRNNWHSFNNMENALDFFNYIEEKKHQFLDITLEYIKNNDDFGFNLKLFEKIYPKFEDEKIKMRIIRTFFFEIKQLKNCISFVKEYENEVKKYVIIDLNNYVCEKVKNCSDNAEYILKNISHELLNKETIDFIGNIFIENTKDIKSLDFFIDKIKQSEKLTTSYEYRIHQNPNQSGNP